MCPDGFAGVFNDKETVPAGDDPEGVHIRRYAEGVHDEERAGPWGNGALHRGGIEIEGCGVNVRKHRRSTNLEDGVGDGDKGEGGDDHFVAFTDAESEQRKVKAGCSGTDGYGVGDLMIRGQRRFKGCKLRAKAEVRGAQNGGYRFDFGFGDVGGRERDGRGIIRTHGRPPILSAKPSAA